MAHDFYIMATRYSSTNIGARGLPLEIAHAMKPQPLEKDIAVLVCNYLAFKGWHVVRTEANAVRSGTNNKRGIVNPSEPDARAFKNDKVLHLEFKRPGKKATLKQKLYHTYLRTFGIVTHVIQSLEDIQNVLEDIK